MSTASGQVIRILRLAAGGDGVGRLEDGRAVFVPRTAPGDLVELARVRSHRRFARALIGRVIGEALPGGAMPAVVAEMVRSDPTASGLVTAIGTQRVGDTRYFDAAGFQGRTIGLNDGDLGSAPTHVTSGSR